MSRPSRWQDITATGTDTLFDGTGDMRALCRAFNWSETPLGTPAAWPRSLRPLVAMLLASRHPMFLWWGPDLIQVYNDAYRPSFGTESRHPRALGMAGAACWTDIWPIIGHEIQQIMNGGAATWHEDHLVPIDRDGTREDVYWTYSYNPAFDDEGAVAGVLVVCQETPARVRLAAEREALIVAEQRARTDAEQVREELIQILAQAPVAVAVLQGSDFLYTVANERYQAMIGRRNPIGRTLCNIFPELRGSEIELVLRRVFEEGVPFAADDLRIRFDSGGDGVIDNYYDLVYHPLTTERGTVSGIIDIAIDVTSRRRAALEREQMLADAVRARAEALEANQANSDSLAVMSHELRTPLNAIGGYAELLLLGLNGELTAEQEIAIARIQKSHRHLLGLVDRVLGYARIEVGHIEYSISAVSVNDILVTSESLLLPQAQSKGVMLRLEERPAVTALADAEKVQQVVLNLLSNAVKFTEPGGTVTLSCSTLRDVICVCVEDTGLGIHADQLGRIFEPFVQIDSRLTRTRDGVGLGLAISRELARGMGGDLTVASVLGSGSAFTFTLRAAPPLPKE